MQEWQDRLSRGDGRLVLVPARVWSDGPNALAMDGTQSSGPPK
jgi:hypothetical protein